VNFRRSWWVRATLRSAGIFGLVVVVGEALAFVQSYALSLPKSDVARIGLLYVAGFHHAGIRIAAAGRISGVQGLAPKGFSVTYELHVALLLVTFGAGALLWMAGRSAAADSTTSGARALRGASVAPAYALLALLASYLARFELPFPHVGGLQGPAAVTISVANLEAFLWPFVVALVAGVLGGLSRGSARAAEVAAVGTRTFVAGLVLAFVGLLVVAGLKPTATRAYLDATAGGGLKGADALAHTALAVPNLATWTLVPAMGACDGVHGQPITGTLRRICYGSFPGRPASPPWFLFLLVPILAVAYGTAGGRTELPVAAAGGAVFAVLAGLCAALAAVGLSASTARVHTHVTIGPQAVTAFAVALGWGVAGGALAVLTWRTLHRGSSAAAS